jgi:hypothetical protein
MCFPTLNDFNDIGRSNYLGVLKGGGWFVLKDGYFLVSVV